MDTEENDVDEEGQEKETFKSENKTYFMAITFIYTKR